MSKLPAFGLDLPEKTTAGGTGLVKVSRPLRDNSLKRGGILYTENSTGEKIMIAGKKIHLIGAGGIGMSGLAVLLLKHNALVAGSDQEKSAVTSRLCKLGADIRIGHDEANLAENTDGVVVSAAIREDNPELIKARKLNRPLYKYAQMLGEMMDLYDGIAVSGTHGKSTTSGWLTYLLKQAGVDTNFIIGADIAQLGASSGEADSNFFVAEACEYDRSFLNLRPQIACILNIEQDHLDYYRDEDEIVDAFYQFACGTKPEGILIANGQDKNVLKLLTRLKKQDSVQKTQNDNESCGLKYIETFGLDEKCDFYATNLTSENGLYSFDVYQKTVLLGRAQISIPGLHNVYNALAVIAIAVNLGIPSEKVLALLGGFTGMDRRLMFKGSSAGITILDDYAHHPTEIRASLAAIRQRYQPRKLWCVFQPHQYSRTRFLLDDFAKSFRIADVTIVPEIYFVRDSLLSKQQINAEILVERLRANGTDAIFIDGFDAICNYLKDKVSDGDVVVTMGAGDIWKVADEYIQWLGRNS